MPWRSRWSGARLSSTATSGANASVSSSWNDEASQTTVAGGVERARERRQRGAHVPRRGDGRPGRAVHRGHELGRRRLPVRAGDRDHLVRQQPPAQLELPDHDDPAGARGADHRRLLRHAGALDHRPDAVEQPGAVAVLVHGDARRLQLRPRLGGDRGAVAARDLLAERAEDQPGGPARSGRGRRAGRVRAAAEGASSPGPFQAVVRTSTPAGWEAGRTPGRRCVRR